MSLLRMVDNIDFLNDKLLFVLLFRISILTFLQNSYTQRRPKKEIQPYVQDPGSVHEPTIMCLCLRYIHERLNSERSLEGRPSGYRIFLLRAFQHRVQLPPARSAACIFCQHGRPRAFDACTEEPRLPTSSLMMHLSLHTSARSALNINPQYFDPRIVR